MKMLRTCCLLVIMALAVAVVPGCADQQVSRATINLAGSLTAISQDLQADSNGYLGRFQEQKLADLQTLQDLTVERLKESGQFNDEAQDAVQKAFDARRTELDNNVKAARASYRIRVEALQTAAQVAVEIDGYYKDRNYNIWRAIGLGAVQGLLDQTGTLQTLVGKIRTEPSPGDSVK